MKASEEMYINGYLRSNFRKDEALSRLLHILGECFHGNLRHGFEFKSKYPNTFDLRPIVYEYDDVFIDILIDNETKCIIDLQCNTKRSLPNSHTASQGHEGPQLYGLAQGHLL